MKQNSLYLFFILAGALWLYSPASCAADDLDDGIPIDDSIMSYDQIGDSVERNYAYIALRAQADIAARMNGSEYNSDDIYTNEGTILNSVILRPGAEVNGDIIIIDNSQGDTTILANMAN